MSEPAPQFLNQTWLKVQQVELCLGQPPAIIFAEHIHDVVLDGYIQLWEMKDASEDLGTDVGCHLLLVDDTEVVWDGERTRVVKAGLADEVANLRVKVPRGTSHHLLNSGHAQHATSVDNNHVGRLAKLDV